MEKFIKILDSIKKNPDGLNFSKFDINEMTESTPEEPTSEKSFHEEPTNQKPQSGNSENDIGSYTKLIYSLVKDFFSGIIEIKSIVYSLIFIFYRSYYL